MKIMSYIQKTIYALFLLALFSGCTDEVLDGGGNGSTPPIEEGKLVDVKFVLNGTNAQTVVTKSDPDEPDADDKLLFLQYKEGNLYHAWYTSMDEADGFDEDDDFNGDSELDGFGKQSQVTVRNVQLRSGRGYVVYVLSNYKVYNSDIDLVEYESDNDYKVKNENYRGVVKKESTIFTKFSTIEDVKSFTISTASGKPSGEEYMFARAYTSSEEVQSGKKQNYEYTWMLTTSSDPVKSFANSVTNEDTPVDITAETNLCASFYVPYAAVSLSIDATGLNSDVQINLKNVSIMNCPKEYRLVNGYSLAQSNTAGSKKEIGEFYRDDDDIKTKKDDDDEIDTNRIILRQGSKYRTVKKYKNGEDKFDVDGYFWVYENMAGILDNPTQKQKLKAPVYDDKYYTYIQVNAQRKDGQGSWKDITYRFILGNDNHSNCNVERNVYYNVTMSLKGDGGIGEDSWRVEYDGKKPAPETPEVEGHDDLSRLDAHASVKEFVIRNMKEGAYYYIAVNNKPSECTIDVNADDYTDPSDIETFYTYNNFAGGFKYSIGKGVLVSMYKGKSDQFYKVVISEDGDYRFKYRQLSWFDYSSVKTNMHTAEANKYNITEPSTVATATPNTYYLHIYEGNKSSIGYLVKTIKVTQYPPIVVNHKSGVSPNDKFENYTVQGKYAYMERFDDDHSGLKEGKKWDNAGGLGTGWTIIKDSNKAYKKQMFDYEDHLTHPDYMNSDYCYWANLHGPYKFTQNPLRQNEGWDYKVDSQKDDLRYIIPWSN